MPDIPIACVLPDSEQAARQRSLQETIGSAVEERVELEDGFALRLPADPKWVRDAAELIAVERACCPFLTLELAVEPGHGPVWLKMRGPEGTKAFLARSFEFCAEG